jgi:hypothetical protein
MDAFLRESEAWEFVQSIPDSKQRLLTELAVCRALSFLIGDADYVQNVKKARVDLLIFARTTHAFFSNMSVLRGVIDGTITSVDDIAPFSVPG